MTYALGLRVHGFVSTLIITGLLGAGIPALGHAQSMPPKRECKASKADPADTDATKWTGKNPLDWSTEKAVPKPSGANKQCTYEKGSPWEKGVLEGRGGEYIPREVPGQAKLKFVLSPEKLPCQELDVKSTAYSCCMRGYRVGLEELAVWLRDTIDNQCPRESLCKDAFKGAIEHVRMACEMNGPLQGSGGKNAVGESKTCVVNPIPYTAAEKIPVRYASCYFLGLAAGEDAVEGNGVECSVGFAEYRKTFVKPKQVQGVTATGLTNRSNGKASGLDPKEQATTSSETIPAK